jgi:hypothetical protein
MENNNYRELIIQHINRVNQYLYERVIMDFVDEDDYPVSLYEQEKPNKPKESCIQ